MSYRLPILAALLCLFLALPCSAEPFRGLWVSAWGEGIKSPAQVDRLVQTAKESGINALLVQVRKRGDAYYQSSLVPRAPEVPAGYDPLGDLLEKAHAEGIQVHAWLVMLLAQSFNAGRPNGLVNLHPDWVTHAKSGRRMTPGQAEGYYLDPALPEVQEHLVAVARELVERYPVDGVNLDYIRYASRKWGYHPRAVWRFKQETGKVPRRSPTLWDQWRRDQVSALVRKVHDAVKAVRAEVQVSADVWASLSEARGNRLQDWERWVRAGWVDFVAPMNYTRNTAVFVTRSAGIYRRNGVERVHMGILDSPVAGSQAAEALRLGGQGLVFYSYSGTRHSYWPAGLRQLASSG